MKRFEYRALNPVVVNEELTFNGTWSGSKEIALWVQNEAGVVREPGLTRHCASNLALPASSIDHYATIRMIRVAYCSRPSILRSYVISLIKGTTQRREVNSSMGPQEYFEGPSLLIITWGRAKGDRLHR